MKPFDYAAPSDLNEALALLQAGGGAARPLAGGSDLLGELKDGLGSAERLVSLARIAALREVRQEPHGLRLGAGRTLVELEHEPELSGPYAVLAEAARGVATPEIRNQGTLGGNLCQRPRCLHFRSRYVPCLKKGGTDCPAAQSTHQPYLSLFGGPHCHAANASDLAPPLLALGASVCIAAPEGERTVPIAQLFAGPERDVTRETTLAPGELVTAVLLPPMPPDWRGTYLKARERTAGDFPLVSVAAGCRIEGGTLRDVRLVLGGVAPVPRPVPAAVALLEGQPPTPERFSQAADAAFADAKPLAHNGYRVQLGRALVTRAMEQVAQVVQRLGR